MLTLTYIVHSTHIGVDHRQGEEEGEAPDQQQGSPAVGGGAEGRDLIGGTITMYLNTI